MKTKTDTFKKNCLALYRVANAVARGGPDAGKDEFHRVGKSVLREIKKRLGVDGDVRSNRGGIAVLGEVILHTDWFYVQLSDNCFSQPMFMYRTCKGRLDYCGGQNLWLSYEQLANDPEHFMDILRDMIGGRS